MRMSRPPKASSANATRAPISSGRETLQWRKAALPPLSVIWRTVSLPPESLMSETSTQQPSEARRTASARPEPSPPDPVTTAILPDNFTEMRPSGDPSYLSRLRVRDHPHGAANSPQRSLDCLPSRSYCCWFFLEAQSIRPHASLSPVETLFPLQTLWHLNGAEKGFQKNS